MSLGFALFIAALATTAALQPGPALDQAPPLLQAQRGSSSWQVTLSTARLSHLTVRLLAVLSILYVVRRLVYNRLSSGNFFPRKLTAADWADQVVVVTGGSGGVGSQLALKLARRGAKVASLDVVQFPEDLLKDAEVAARIKSYQCDLTNWQALQGIGAAIRKDLGGVTMLVNNAGIVTDPKKSLFLTDGVPANETEAQQSSERIQRTIDINLTSQLWTLREFIPDMKKSGKGGHVVTVASIMGHVGVPGLADYVVSKFGLVGLHQTIKRELRRERGNGFPIQATLVMPSHISTPMFKHWTVPFPFNYLTPSVTPQAVAGAIFAALESGQSHQLYVPSLTAITQFHAIVPEEMYEAMQIVSWHIINTAIAPKIDHFLPLRRRAVGPTTRCQGCAIAHSRRQSRSRSGANEGDPCTICTVGPYRAPWRVSLWDALGR